MKEDIHIEIRQGNVKAKITITPESVSGYNKIYKIDIVSYMVRHLLDEIQKQQLKTKPVIITINERFN